jgi:C4-dicarboxylate-specific signal transduction histidine kinase
MSDNGTGLSSKVFAELTHEDQLLEEQLGSRRGLGLRLSRRLLERFGGKIEIDTEYEKQSKGTKFNLYLRGVADAIDEQKSTNF